MGWPTLVSRRYLPQHPDDPHHFKAARHGWVLPRADPQKGAVFDVKSGARGPAATEAYEQW